MRQAKPKRRRRKNCARLLPEGQLANCICKTKLGQGAPTMNGSTAHLLEQLFLALRHVTAQLIHAKHPGHCHAR